MDFLNTVDTQLFFLINHSFANPVLDLLCPLLRNKLTWIPFYLAAAVYLFVKYKSKALWVICAAVICIVLADQISSSLIKPFFGRLRPCNDAQIKDQVRLLIECGKGFSFVSSHAANHFALAVFFALFFSIRKLTITLLAWAFSIAISQVYVGVHYPADVLAGGLLGVTVGWLVFKIFAYRLNTFPSGLQSLP